MSESPSTSAKWELHPMQIPGLASVYRIDAAGLGIGRDEDNRIQLDEKDYPHVSGHHARIILRGEQVVLEDLRSKNGTYVNGRRVSGVRLFSGDVVRLGSQGPAFAVADASSPHKTLAFAPQVKEQDEPEREFGKTTILNLKKALGLPEGATSVGELVEKRSRRSVRLSAAVVLGLMAVFAGVVWYSISAGQREIEGLRDETRRIDERVREGLALIRNQETARTQREQEYKASEDRLRRERDEVIAQITKIEQKGASSSAEVDRLRVMLEENERRLEKYDPVNLARSQLAQVKRVADAVVFIEVAWRFRERESGKLVVVRRGTEGQSTPVLDLGEENGAPYQPPGNGSGFCVSADGWIITNAHVVNDSGAELAETGFDLAPERCYLNVIFTGQELRLPAAIERITPIEQEDLALLKVDSSQPLPFIDLTTSTPVPELGSEVYLLGFPLGRAAPHVGERMIASTFKGILSREVAPYLQVDAAVHPGNSGGPVVDREGRVIGIVVGVQTNPFGGLASEMGYAIPIARARQVWPRASDAGVDSK